MKYFTLFLIIFSFLLVACGGSEAQEPPLTAEISKAVPETEYWFEDSIDILIDSDGDTVTITNGSTDYQVTIMHSDEEKTHLTEVRVDGYTVCQFEKNEHMKSAHELFPEIKRPNLLCDANRRVTAFGKWDVVSNNGVEVIEDYNLNMAFPLPLKNEKFFFADEYGNVQELRLEQYLISIFTDGSKDTYLLALDDEKLCEFSVVFDTNGKQTGASARENTAECELHDDVFYVHIHGFYQDID